MKHISFTKQKKEPYKTTSLKAKTQIRVIITPKDLTQYPPVFQLPTVDVSVKKMDGQDFYSISPCFKWICWRNFTLRSQICYEIPGLVQWWDSKHGKMEGLVRGNPPNQPKRMNYTKFHQQKSGEKVERNNLLITTLLTSECMSTYHWQSKTRYTPCNTKRTNEYDLKITPLL